MKDFVQKNSLFNKNNIAFTQKDVIFELKNIEKFA